MSEHEKYMQRCFDLAVNGCGLVAPNPMVGCVIVADQRIVGEGYHRQYGASHAEVNAIRSVKDKHILSDCTLYVNLEPCAHWGKTPPCANLIVENKIPRVVIGCLDPFSKVNGKGAQLLRDAGIEVTIGVLENESLKLNRRFFTFHQEKRPYLILKWAQTLDGFIARKDFSSQWISNQYSRLWVHHLRSREGAVMVGTRTALYDNPQLTARDMSHLNPVRVVVDRNLTIPKSHQLLCSDFPTIVFTQIEEKSAGSCEYHCIDFESDHFTEDLLDILHSRGIQSAIIEGGSSLLNTFLSKNFWDEAFVFYGNSLFHEGIPAPVIKGSPILQTTINRDRLIAFYNENRS